VTKRKASFTRFEILLLSIALLLTILLIRVTVFELLDKKRIGDTIGIVIGLIYLGIFISQFESLRKNNIFAGWLIIGFIHFCMFLGLRSNSYLAYLDKYDIARSHSGIFTIPIITLIFFQLCRQFSLHFYKSELELLGDSTNYVHEKRRYFNFVERLYYIGMVAIPGIIVYLSYYL
jgi:hypothetical protein